MTLLHTWKHFQQRTYTAADLGSCFIVLVSPKLPGWMPQNVCTRVSLGISAESSCCLLVACGATHPTKPSSPSSWTAPEIPLTWTSTCFTCRLSAWAEVALSQEHALSPDPAYGSRTWKKQQHPPLCTNSEMTPLKSLTKKVWYMWISSKPHIDFLFFFFFLWQHPQFMLSHTWVPPL